MYGKKNYFHEANVINSNELVNVLLNTSDTFVQITQKEINDAFTAKYGVNGGGITTSYYDIVLCK